MVRAEIANSHHRRDWVLRTLYGDVLTNRRDPVIAVLGLAYKQDTHSTKNSPSLALLQHLAPYDVRVFDPVVAGEAVVHPRCYAARSESDACDGADVLVVMTPWKQFGSLDPAQLATRMRGNTVVDPYSALDARRCRAAGLRYITLGITPPEQA